MVIQTLSIVFRSTVKYNSNLLLLFIDDSVMRNVPKAVLSRIDFVWVELSCKIMVEELVHALLIPLRKLVICLQSAL